MCAVEGKHKDRDISLPIYRQSIKNNIEQDLVNDDNVLALYYGGSIATDSTDLYSDIDLRIVVKDEKYEEYRLKKKQRAKNWGKVLFYEDFPWASHSVAHFDGFIKVDSFYYTMKDIQPSVWMKNIKIVKDRTEMIEEILEKSLKLDYQPTVEEFELWRSKFFAHAHEVYRGIKRKEFYYALNYLDALRLAIVKGWSMDAGIQPNNPGYWAKIEGDRSNLATWQLSLLKTWSSGRDPNEIQQTLEKMIPEFIKIHRRLCRKLDVEENAEWVSKILHQVI
jgi:predicted nucleotidyltransferase